MKISSEHTSSVYSPVKRCGRRWRNTSPIIPPTAKHSKILWSPLPALVALSGMKGKTIVGTELMSPVAIAASRHACSIRERCQGTKSDNQEILLKVPWLFAAALLGGGASALWRGFCALVAGPGDRRRTISIRVPHISPPRLSEIPNDAVPAHAAPLPWGSAL